MAVDDLGVPAEGLGFALLDVEVVLEHCSLALAEPVDVDDVDQVVELVVGGEGHGFPDAALGALTVSAQTVDSVAAFKSYARYKITTLEIRSTLSGLTQPCQSAFRRKPYRRQD